MPFVDFNCEAPTQHLDPSREASINPLFSQFPIPDEAWTSAAFSDSDSQNIAHPQLSFSQPFLSAHQTEFPALGSPSLTATPPLAAHVAPATHFIGSSTVPAQSFGSSPEERQAYYIQRFTVARWKKHSPQWVDGDWLPLYKYASANAIWDYWVEWKEGVDGFISVEDLTTTWGAKWRRNNSSLKNENGRRMKVINLILELSRKPRWNVNLARRFITDTYASHYRARAFADYLKDNRAAVIAAADNYP
ncbi:hypothetical protein DFH07DRAFT_781801 [Mycena maculata]|uniref:Transcription activator GCR1-like domain-containing protein n=1 Tax=Mycena maculata TaxID=230809 RepID=A0AAD7HXG8_9AGAR|nr:hypothetical protein DFH07DRAFT_781801 [Mycena maculata]